MWLEIGVRDPVASSLAGEGTGSDLASLDGSRCTYGCTWSCAGSGNTCSSVCPVTFPVTPVEDVDFESGPPLETAGGVTAKK